MRKLVGVATDCEIFLKICLFISTEYTNVTDKRRMTAQASVVHSIARQT